MRLPRGRLLALITAFALLISALLSGTVAAAQDPEALALAYLRARAAAVLGGDVGQAAALVAPKRRDVRAFVAHTLTDLASKRRELGSLGARTQVFINGIETTGTGWTVFGTDAYWFDRPNDGTGEGEGKFAQLTDAVLTAAVAFTHEIRIDRGLFGPLLSADAHRYFGERSPDYTRPDGGASFVPVSGAGKLAAVPPRPLTYQLNSSNMRFWASLYWGPNESNYHPSYDNYNSSGGDCVNFVSQAMNYGGMPMESQTIPNREFGCWNCWWYSNTAGTGTFPHSGVPWRYVPRHMNYLVQSGRGMWESGPTRIGVGDPIYFDWGWDGIYDHAVIVSGYTSEALVAGHNTNMFDFPYRSISGGARKFIYTFITGTP
jgi:hypothetical protein